LKDEDQYDLLWSRQVSQKRLNLIKKKEDSLRARYQQKMAKIEEIQRRKLEEKKSKSKSPSHYVPSTTMSDFECTPH
jgi:hypothetical protein